MVGINDLDFVFSDAGLDRGAYRSFPLALQSRTSGTVSAQAASPTDAPPAESRKGPAVPQAEQHASARRVPVLDGLLAQMDEVHPAGEQGVSRAVSLMGAAGGVGTTTIAATLARISSRRGSKVLLLDSAEESIIPLYLGAGQTASKASANLSLLPRPESLDGAISVIVCGVQNEEGADISPWSRARNLSGIAGEVLIDSGSYLYHGGTPQEASETTCVIVLVPDIRCVLQVRRIEKMFADRGYTATPFYLLNRFEETSALHRQVRATLANYLGARLAPVAIRNASEIPEALSEGLTVIDSAPGSPVAADFAEVSGWLRTAATPPPQLRSHEAAAGLP